MGPAPPSPADHLPFSRGLIHQGERGCVGICTWASPLPRGLSTMVPRGTERVRRNSAGRPTRITDSASSWETEKSDRRVSRPTVPKAAAREGKRQGVWTWQQGGHYIWIPSWPRTPMGLSLLICKTG